MKDQLKKLLPHLGIILGFIAISTIYFYPELEGKTLRQSDLLNVSGTRNQIGEYNETHDEPALWTDASFSGMPTLIMNPGKNLNFFTYLSRITRLGLPNNNIAILFIYLISFYFLGVSLRLGKWLSAIGAIAFAFASYNIIIIGAGHTSKAYAIGYMPIAIAGLILIFREKYIKGALISTAGVGLSITSGHPQISYYLAIAIFLFFLFKAYDFIKIKKHPQLLKIAGLLILSAILGIAPASKKLLTTYSYSQHSIRGERILEKVNNKHLDGLDKDYALEWSYGKAETFTVLIPNFMGGASHGVLDESSKTYKALEQRGVQKPEQIVNSLSTYWGDMRFTEGPVYFGAVICFLFVLGLFTIRSTLKWWVVSVSVLALFLSWGENFMGFTNFFFYNIPFYNKFRTVSMILVLIGLLWPILGLVGIKEFLNHTDKAKQIKYLKFSFFILGGILLFFILFGKGLFDFSAHVDQRYISSGYPQWLIDVLKEDRKALFQKDALRSLIFINLFAGALYLHITHKLKYKYFLLIGGLLIFIDLWSVSKRYVNNDDFQKKTIKEAHHNMKPADQFILQDTTHYRVLNLNSPFTEANTSYYHNSIGGYHGAKLRRYQDLIERQLQREINMFINAFSQKKANSDMVNQLLQKTNCLNMLNTKYIIYNPKAKPLLNSFAAGPCWFIDQYEIVEDSEAEINALNNFQPQSKAFFHQSFAEQLDGLELKNDPSASIHISKKDFNHKKYLAKTNQTQIAVFSEIYYPDGWQAYIDGERVPIMRCNYVLRSLVIPKGEHEIEFIFKPESYYTGKKISIISSWAVGILFLLGLLYYFGSRSRM